MGFLIALLILTKLICIFILIFNFTEHFTDDVEFRLKFVNIYYLFDDCEEGIDEVYQR